ncbi:MAG: hypothetical protein AAF203_05550, partial [Pseudomonadota bacterium]
FDMKDKEMTDWSAIIATPKLVSDDYEFDNLKVKAARRETSSADLRVTSTGGVVREKAMVLPWLEPTRLDKVWGGQKEIGFKEMSVKLEVFQNKKILWKRGYLRTDKGWQLSSEGEREPDRKVLAWFQWDRPDSQFLRWGYQGTFFDGQWKPETPWIKKWLSENPQFLKNHRSIAFLVEKEESLTEKINEVGQQAVQKVKEALIESRDKKEVKGP